MEISESLEKEEIKLRQMQTETVSKSARGDNQRLELWNTFLPKIRTALKKVINDEEEAKSDRGSYIYILYIHNNGNKH